MKELDQRLEDLTESNDEFKNKLREETEKHDSLLEELIERKETFRLAAAKNAEIEEKLDKQL